MIIQGELYKMGYLWPLLKCIAPTEADYVLREIYEGIYGNHIEARMTNKALKA